MYVNVNTINPRESGFAPDELEIIRYIETVILKAVIIFLGKSSQVVKPRLFPNETTSSLLRPSILLRALSSTPLDLKAIILVIVSETSPVIFRYISCDN